MTERRPRAPVGLLRVLLCAVALKGAAVSAQAQLQPAPDCADLRWSADVRAANPDIDRICRGVYQREGKLYAKASIEVVKVQGTRLYFRPVYTDNSLGETRSINMDSSFRASIGGKLYTVGELPHGQQLNVYLSEDRFALVMPPAVSTPSAAPEAPEEVPAQGAEPAAESPAENSGGS